MNKSTAVPESTVGKWSEKKRDKKYLCNLYLNSSEWTECRRRQTKPKNDAKESSLYMEEPCLNNVLLSDH